MFKKPVRFLSDKTSCKPTTYRHASSLGWWAGTSCVVCTAYSVRLLYAIRSTQNTEASQTQSSKTSVIALRSPTHPLHARASQAPCTGGRYGERSVNRRAFGDTTLALLSPSQNLSSIGKTPIYRWSFIPANSRRRRPPEHSRRPPTAHEGQARRSIVLRAIKHLLAIRSKKR